MGGNKKFKKFVKSVHPETWQNQQKLLIWAKKSKNSQRIEDPINYEKSDDPIVRQGYHLLQEAKKNYKNKLAHVKKLRILIHMPYTEKYVIAGYSLFSNLIEGLKYISITVDVLTSKDNIKQVFTRFKPNVFISSDNEQYIKELDWPFINQFRLNNELKIGLTASLAEYGNTPLKDRLRWAKQNNISFYYSYRDQDYVHDRKEYQPFFADGYDIFSVEFGANILKYYPIPNIKRDINYIFLGTGAGHGAKEMRYMEYFKDIFKNYTGLINGPGWNKQNWNLNNELDRYLYARAKIGLNLHVAGQLNWASELNERTYMLAACGVPQLIDAPKLLPYRFSDDSVFTANSAKEYHDLFMHILNNPCEAQQKALRAQKEVFAKYTNFHRAEQFVHDMLKIIK